LPDNVARILPPGRRVFVSRGSWPVPPVFGWLQKLGNVADAEMARVFNLGVGFVMVVSPHFAESIVKQLDEAGVPARVIGDVRPGEPGVDFA
jgi:phosphoribosylformylglycinamidine cyclo-ligase